MGKTFWQTDRLRLRVLEESDRDFFLSRRQGVDAEADWYEDKLRFPLSETEAGDAFKEMREDYSKDDKRLFLLDVLEEAGPCYAGEISVWYTNRRAGVLRYGIRLEEAWRGKGLAREALIRVLDFYFNELNYQKAAPYAYSYNPRSLAFHKKFGFRQEAVIPREVYSRGVYHDCIFFGMFKEEFNRLYGEGLWRV